LSSAGTTYHRARFDAVARIASSNAKDNGFKLRDFDPGDIRGLGPDKREATDLLQRGIVRLCAVLRPVGPLWRSVVERVATAELRHVASAMDAATAP
jgi:hypothetical protein